jgi:hypothetical protein
MMAYRRVLLTCWLTVSLGSCDFLDQAESLMEVVVEMPEVSVGDVTLARSPAFRQLASYYCPRVYSVPLVEDVCRGLVGTPPPERDLFFRFVLPLEVGNPNEFPLPAVSLLTALEVFSGSDARELSAVCIRFCDTSEADCNPYAPDACYSDDPEIRSLDDFAGAALNYLTVFVANSVQGTVPPELRVKTIPAQGKATVFITFDVAPGAVLSVLEVLFLAQVDKLVSGEAFSLSIPYSIQGSIWFHVQNFGRFGVSYGPVDGIWEF